MALIVCKKCGKKISDTVENCIHCGASISEEKDIFTESDTVSDKADLKANSTQQDKIIDYDSFNEEDKIKLESEFLSSDKWAAKFRRTKIELPKFRAVLILPLWGFLGWGLFYKYYIANQTVYDVNKATASAILIVALFAVSLISLIATHIVGKVHKKSVNRYIYMKKYQQWLLNEKKISFIPTFVKTEEKIIFDNINIDNMKL